MNVIFCNANTLLDVSIIQKLANVNMEFVLITATKEIKSALKGYYNIDSSLVDDYRTLDRYKNVPALNDSYKSTEFLSILDRYRIIGDLNLHTRQAFFNNAWDYWSNFVDNHRIDFVIFKMVPHLLYDFVLHEVCEEKKIKKVIIEKTYWQDIILLEATFRSKTYLENHKKLQIIEDITSEIKINKVPYWTKAKAQRQNKAEGIVGPNLLTIANLKNIAEKMLEIFGPKEYGFYDGKYRNIKETSQDNFARRLNIHRKINKLNDKIKSEYENVIVDYEAIKDSKNIVFYLQCQPEKSTSPLGGVYVDQIFAIKTLLEWLPRDYQLLVKEHPSQFSKWQNLPRGRSPGYYKKIADMGCKIISHKIDNLELFESTALTISTTGSVVFEAWVLGYKAGFLGFPWYNLFNIRRISCRDDITALLDKPADTSQYVEKIAELKSVGYLGYADEYSETRFLLEKDLNLAAIEISNALAIYARASNSVIKSN